MNTRLMTSVVALLAGSVMASSHREAPGIAGMPRLDATDFYMFRSYEPGREGFVTIVANYMPLQDAYGGPNYFTLDENGLYAIHIDNNGDATPDLSFRFRFTNTRRGTTLNIGGQAIAVPLINTGQITVPGDPDLNVVESFVATVRRGWSCNDEWPDPQDRFLRNAATNSATFLKPVDNIGAKSLPDYPGYAAAHMYTVALPNSNLTGRLFVGQRKDPFVVNLGEIFDLVNTNPLGPPNAERDDLADKNVTSIVLELPIAYLTTGSDPVIGGWTSASARSVQVLSTGWIYRPPVVFGKWSQVSRLGMPLVNEVVIGLPDKNKFNASEPRQDGQFLKYVTNPTLPALLQALFGVTAPATPRNDLVQVFLTGVPGLNQPASIVPSEMLRLNTDIMPTPAASQSRLGVLGGDLAGFPNGRRPGDDVVDMALRVVMGVLLPASAAPSGQLPYTDGAFLDSTFFDGSWPYLKTPLAGSPN